MPRFNASNLSGIERILKLRECNELLHNELATSRDRVPLRAYRKRAHSHTQTLVDAYVRRLSAVIYTRTFVRVHILRTPSHGHEYFHSIALIKLAARQ